ncbi:MAG: hypothetical protein ACFCVG_02780 [Kineosporiaceae bacterium]
MAADLRRTVLAAAVVDDLPVSVDPAAGDAPEAPAVVVTDPASDRSALLTWEDVAVAVGAWRAEPTHPVTRGRVSALVTGAGLVAAAGAPALAAAVRAHVEVAGSPRSCGPGWSLRGLGAGPLAVGWGVVAPPTGHLTWPLPMAPTIVSALSECEPDLPAAVGEVERLGGALVERLERDRREGRDLVLRPMGWADVPTLLLSPTLRRWLADRDGTGLGTLAVPTRRRGWTDIRRIDPPYVAAAHAATDAVDAACPVPLLVTADGVVGPRTGDRTVAPGHPSGDRFRVPDM